MKNFLLFNRLVPVNREEHAAVRVRPVRDYTFTSRVNSVLLTGFEFPLAMREYPIIFVGGSDDTFMPAAMLGTGADENCFVSGKGRWTGKYLPLYIRQYPFMAAEKKEKDTVVICIDAEYEGFDVKDGQPLFSADGREMRWFAEMSRMAAAYLGYMQQTIPFCRTLQDLDLLVPLNPRLENRKTGAVTRIEGLYAVNEERLNNLADEQVLLLYRRGYLAWIYLHLASLANLGPLANR